MKYINYIRKASKKVFCKNSYAFLAIAVFTFFLVGTIFLSNHQFIGYVITSDAHAFSEKLRILWLSLGFFDSNFTKTSQIFVVIISALAGWNVSLAVYYMKGAISVRREAGVSLLGLVSGILGVGCSACGSVLFTSVFGLSASAGIIGFLPLHGAEFSLLGIILLFVSIAIVSERIVKPPTCKI
jgi:hypothetical protein